MLPTEVEHFLGDGVWLRYTRPVLLNEDYAIMPEALVSQQLDSFIEELDSALDSVENERINDRSWLAFLLLLTAAFWTAAWLIWRGLS